MSSGDQVDRRLAAVMAGDIAGFSSLMEKDEEGTFARVRTLRDQIVRPQVAAHRGRLVKTTGDGFLAEFASPLDAVRCALEIQEENGRSESAGRGAEPLRLRIGINLGDIIIEEGDVYGEGVNVAARLEALSEPGGICISGKVFDEVEGKVAAAFQSRGEQSVKNIAGPVRVYALQAAASPRPPETGKPLPLPSRPAVRDA